MQPAKADDTGSKECNGHVSNSEEETEDPVGKYREAYSALLILDATPREVVDLWMRFRELKKSEPDCKDKVPPYLWTIVDFVLLAIEEQDFLTEEPQDHLRFAFPTSHKDDLQVVTDKFDLKPKVSRKIEVSSEDVLVRKHLDWKLGISGNEAERMGPVPYLPPRPAAWIILLHDLVWNWKKDSITKNLVHGLLKETERRMFLRTPDQDRPGFEDLGWAWYRDKDKWVHFPFPKLDSHRQFPKFDTFRKLDRFLMVWSADLPSPDSKKLLNLDTLLRRWVFAAWIAEGLEDLYDKYATGKLKMPESKEDEEKIENGMLIGYRSNWLRSDPILDVLATKEQQ